MQKKVYIFPSFVENIPNERKISQIGQRVFMNIAK